MKIRQGFVSNSSASSFIVQIHKDWWKKKSRRNISRQQEALLKKYGFKRTNQHALGLLTTTRFVEQFDDVVAENDDVAEVEDGINYGFYVSCNQDDVIEFLVKHRIPFKAMLHYGHETAIYDGNDEEDVNIFANYGLRAEMYGTDRAAFMGDAVPGQAIRKWEP